MSRNLTCVRWAVDLKNWKPTPQELSLAIACIQPLEKERLIKFHFRDDFDASLVGRLLMRKFIQDTTKLPYNEIEFDRDIRGKPFIKNNLKTYQNVSFNVSHQGDYSIFGGIYNETQNCNDDNIEIGVDIMKIEYTGGKSLSEFFRLMDRTFSKNEWKFIKGQTTETKQLKAFMRNWCLKESYVKNVGVGITINLEKICFNIKTENLIENTILTDTTLKINDTTPMTNWLFEEHLLDGKHCVALAFKNIQNKEIAHEKFIVLNFDDLMKDCIPLNDNDELYCQQVFAKEYKNRNFI